MPILLSEEKAEANKRCQLGGYQPDGTAPDSNK